MIYGCYSIKGGVGKTALAVNLAAYFAGEGRRVLLVDLDPQGAAAFHFSITGSTGLPEFDGKRLSLKWAREAIRHTDRPALDILPSSFDWRMLDLRLAEMKKPRKSWRRLLTDLGEDYEAIVLDAPPNITLLAETVFRAADVLLVPVIPTPLSERTLEQLHEFLGEDSASKLRPFFSMVQAGKSLHRSTRPVLRGRFPGFLRGEIPFASAVERMGVLRRPLVDSHSTHGAAGAFRELCAEIAGLKATPEKKLPDVP